MNDLDIQQCSYVVLITSAGWGVLMVINWYYKQDMASYVDDCSGRVGLIPLVKCHSAWDYTAICYQCLGHHLSTMVVGQCF